MPSIRHLIHPSGGLVYHLRARRHGDMLWRAYLAEIALWLRDWRPNTEHLVLIGPSAGYSLSQDFLTTFGRVTALEPDALARILLRRRFPSVRFEFAGPMARLAQLPVEYPGAAYLFCNVLGQDWTDAAAPDWRREFHDSLAGTAWASYHDIVSTTRRPDFPGSLDLPAAPDFDALLARFWMGGELVVEDHATHGLFPERPRRYVIWPLNPERFHLIECLRG